MGSPWALKFCYGSSLPDGNIFMVNLLLQWQWRRNNNKEIIILVIFSNLPHFGSLLEPLEGPPGAIIPYFSVLISNIFQSGPSPRFLINLLRNYKENHVKILKISFFQWDFNSITHMGVMNKTKLIGGALFCTECLYFRVSLSGKVCHPEEKCPVESWS